MPTHSTQRQTTNPTVRTIWELNGCSCPTCTLDDMLGPVDKQTIGLLRHHPTLDFCPCTCHKYILHHALTRILDNVDQYDILQGAFDTTPIYERGYSHMRPFDLPTLPHNHETQRAWNEAKAIFGIGADEEPEGDLNEHVQSNHNASSASIPVPVSANLLTPSTIVNCPPTLSSNAIQAAPSSSSSGNRTAMGAVKSTMQQVYPAERSSAIIGSQLFFGTPYTLARPSAPR